MVDPSGGVNDSMALAIGHRDGHIAVLDRLLEIRPPFNPDDAVRECADLCRAYGITKIVADKYAAQWPVARFSEQGIALEQSAKPKSDLYLNFLSLANSGRCELLDNGRMLSQFAGLQRRTARSGRDSVDHARDTHDDVCNVAAGVLVNLDLDRRPALVRQADMLNNGAAASVPTRCKFIIAVLVVDKFGSAAVIYAARLHDGTGPPLLLLDFEVESMNLALFRRIGERVRELSACYKPQGSIVFVYPAELLNHALAVGLVAEAVPEHVDPDMLLLSASNHVGAGSVKICDAVLEKSRTSTFGAALDFRASEGADDPLRAAALLMIGMALDIPQ